MPLHGGPDPALVGRGFHEHYLVSGLGWSSRPADLPHAEVENGRAELPAVSDLGAGMGCIASIGTRRPVPGGWLETLQGVEFEQGLVSFEYKLISS